MAWTREDAAHLLRRTGFGGDLDQVEMLYGAGQAGAIDHVLNYGSIPDPVWSDYDPLALPDPSTAWSVRRNLLYRLMTSPRSLQSRLMWFWHAHFTTHLDIAGAHPMWSQMLTFRVNALGNFLNLLLAIYRDVGMLRYLDGDSNTKEHPNENFARECMELFTCGPGRYTENDVREAARAFTGWQIPYQSDGHPGNIAIFNPAAHDAGGKVILARMANFDGEGVMRLLFSLPETGRRICTKLYREFVSTRTNPTELDGIVDVWQRTGGDLRQVMAALLNCEGFWDPMNRQTLIKSPLQFCVGLIERLGLVSKVDTNVVGNVYGAMRRMGHEPFTPPNVAGYPSGSQLIGGNFLLSRYRYAFYTIYGIDPSGLVSRMVEGLPPVPTKEVLIATLPGRMGLGNPSQVTLTAISKYLGLGYGGEILATTLKEKVLGTLYLLACSPEFQLT